MPHFWDRISQNWPQCAGVGQRQFLRGHYKMVGNVSISISSLLPNTQKSTCSRYVRIFVFIKVSQCPEMILNKIEKTFNKTYTGLKSFFQRFQICFSQNPSCKGTESTSQATVPNWPNSGCIGCTAQPVDSVPLLTARILRKIGLESPKKTL